MAINLSFRHSRLDMGHAISSCQHFGTIIMFGKFHGGGGWTGKIANRQVFNERNQLWQAIPKFHVDECYTNECQLRDSNRNTTNAGSMRSNFGVLEGQVYDCKQMLVI